MEKKKAKKYDFYKMESVGANQPYYNSKRDMAHALGISRPTLDKWLEKYHRDIKLIEDNLAGKEGKFKEMENDIFIMKEFISATAKEASANLPPHKVLNHVKKWYAKETAKQKALIKDSLSQYFKTEIGT